MEDGGARFRVWAPEARRVSVVIEAGAGRSHQLGRSPNGEFTGFVAGLSAGATYRYQLDDRDLLPDPASRFQPDGVHGPSMIVDPSTFVWNDDEWTGVRLSDLVIYELHVGVFSPEGSFRGVASRLDFLAGLGVTAIELMPIAESSGRWNWGYDNVDLFAPSHNYGTPDDLRALVDAAHAHGIAVLLDVVYNHLGPDGAYIYRFSPSFRTERHKTPWGAGVNLDGPGSETVRAFLIDNALHWMNEYHVDGLRLDATHALQDHGPRHFLAELAETVHASAPNRHVLIVAEDERNEAALVTEIARGGHGLDAVWADDFHHQVRRAVAGDREGYYQSYSGTAADIAQTVRQGWFFTGQFSPYLNGPRGTVPVDVPLERFVFCIQNHDQIGNRALGDRLSHRIDPAAYRAASALLLLAPETPLLFMGQEWAASSPFLYFTDHEPALGRAITEGRREEFAAFAAFADPGARAAVPDPQDPQTFEASRLRWDELELSSHAAVLRLYRALLALRRSWVAAGAATLAVEALDDDTVMMSRQTAGTRTFVVVRLRGDGRVVLTREHAAAGLWRIVLTTEDREFADDGQPPVLDVTSGIQIDFRRPSAIVIDRA